MAKGLWTYPVDTLWMFITTWIYDGRCACFPRFPRTCLYTAALAHSFYIRLYEPENFQKYMALALFMLSHGGYITYVVCIGDCSKQIPHETFLKGSKVHTVTTLAAKAPCPNVDNCTLFLSCHTYTNVWGQGAVPAASGHVPPTTYKVGLCPRHSGLCLTYITVPHKVGLLRRRTEI
jgi:hypothetical protein